jgi:endoglucanase
VNISHWLSQRAVEEPKPAHYFSEMDVAFLKEKGFDHLRLPVDEPILWDDDGNKREDEWERLHTALAWCHQYDMRANVDLHIVRSHHFNSADQGKENPLWSSEKAQDELVALWHKLSGELKDYPVSEVAYEILNEPVSPDTEVWNHILNRVHSAIRSLEPERKLIIGSNMWQKTRTVPELRLPENDPNIIISFHYYEPGMVTHYKSSWTALRDYDGPVQYPGIPFPEIALPENPSPALKKLLDDSNKHYDREVIRSDILTAVEFARSKGLQIYCGEWGCLRSTPDSLRHRWFADVISVFDEFDIGWTIWDYKGGFYLVHPQSLKADTALIDLLLGHS